MTGPQHFREAERDLKMANEVSINDGTAAFYLASAQVHATLALAAATANTSLIPADFTAWREATS